MNGATSLLRTAADGGVRVCFTNPGTTELPFVLALDDVPQVRPVLGLFEGVCTGAADGYARMTGDPAMALLHLGPGLANGLANLHNARRARSAVVTVVGDHATGHHAYDPPLTSDIEALAGPMSTWVGTARSADEMAPRIVEALAAARRDGPAALVVPADAQWSPVRGPVPDGAGTPAGDALPRPDAAPPPAGSRFDVPVPAAVAVSDTAVTEAARLLTTDAPAALLLGADGLTPRALAAAARISAATGCALLSETFPARMERGGGLVAPQRLPYPVPQARAVLEGTAVLVLAGATTPVAFFAYPDQPPTPVPDGAAVHHLARPAEDVADALERLADRFGDAAAPSVPRPVPAQPPALPVSGPLTPDSVGAVLAALQPEGAIVVDEAITSGRAYFPLAAGAPRHSYLALTGGAIGQGLPCATGAAIACPDRSVIAFQADGSAMYTLQALWTQAREGLDVTTLLCANGSYRILQSELGRAGAGAAGGAGPGAASAASTLTDLGDPTIGWVHLAEGLGVPARQITAVEELVPALRAAIGTPGPQLLELVL